MKLKNILASILAVAILFTFVIPTMNSAAATNGVERNIQVKTEVAHKATDVKTDDAQVQGGKLGFLIKLALQLAKTAVKYGGDILSKIIKPLDKETAKYLKDNSSKVAKGLDNALKKIDDAQDYVESQIRSILYSSLKSAGVPGTYALPIADAIAKVVMALA